MLKTHPGGLNATDLPASFGIWHKAADIAPRIIGINTLKIPIQAWLASIKVIAGKNYSPISLNDFFSFLMLMVATIVYNDKKEISKKKSVPENEMPLIGTQPERSFEHRNTV